MSCEDQIGFEKLCEVLAQLGGSVIPVVALLNLSCSLEAFPFQSSIEFLLSSKRLHRLAFPAMGGVLQWEQGQSHLRLCRFRILYLQTFVCLNDTQTQNE